MSRRRRSSRAEVDGSRASVRAAAARAMGQAPSTERRAYKVLLAPGTTHEEHSEIMELVKTKGGSIGFIYWPEPLGFTGTLHEEHLRLLRGRSEVALIIDDDYDGGDGDDLSFTRANTAPAPAPRMEEEDDDSWSSWVCASNRRPRQQQMPVSLWCISGISGMAPDHCCY